MWFFLIAVVFVNVVEASDRCLPLSEETATYRYYQYNGSRHVDGPPAVKDSSGRYPRGTHAKRFCKGSDEATGQGLFVAQCQRNQWFYYKDVKPCKDYRCQPLTPNETVSNYKYRRGIPENLGAFEVVEPDADGKYPEFTYIQRTCNGFPENSRLQNKMIAAFCFKAEWVFGPPETCPSQGSCFDDDIRTKLKYHGYSYESETAVVDFIFLNDNAYYFLEGSQVNGICKGWQVPLWCEDGQWVGSVKTISCDMFT